VNKEKAKVHSFALQQFVDKQMLNIKTKVHYVTILHHVIPAFKSPFPGFLD
jgi:hypothetical protein